MLNLARFYFSTNLAFLLTINNSWSRVDELNDSQVSISHLAKHADFEIESLFDHTNLATKSISNQLFLDPVIHNHTAFVRELDDNQFTVAIDIQQVIPTLINMNQLAYTMGREETLKILSLTNELTNLGWTIRPFNGFTGKNNRAQDVPGFVGYNHEKNQFAIVLRGSHTKVDEVQSADWEVNLDGEMINTIHGKFHQGFYNRSNAMIDNIVTELNYFYDRMSPQQRSIARITVTGHSQGAALATLIAASLADKLKDDSLLGPTFNNQISNTITAYLLSAPRIGDQQAREWIHQQLGKQNIVRQNVVGLIISDPVPSASPGRTLSNLLKKIPFIGNNLALKFGGSGGAASVGYLAAALAKDTLTRNLKSEDLALRERIKDRLNLTTSQLYTLIDDNPVSFFKILAPQQLRASLNTLVVKNVNDILETYLAPLHYGGSKDQFREGAFFQPSVVAGFHTTSPQLAQLLYQGAVKKDKSWNGFKQKIKLFLGI